MLAQRVLDAIDPDEVIAFLQGLVRIPSVNPPGDVQDAIAYVQGTLADAGFSCRTEAAKPEKPNLIAELGGGEGPTLLFNAHVDVVPIGERSAWTYDPWGAEIHDGRVYGRGAGDDKASVTAQVMAGVAIARSGIPLRGTLIVNEVADEEVAGIDGTGFLVENGLLNPDMVIVGEQTFNRVNVGEKGGAGTKIVVTGRTAHGALPWEGANAIEAMAEIITALRRELYPKLKERTHPYFHPSSASVNMIAGGVKENVVPDRCEVYLDRRIIPGEDPQAVIQEIREIAERAVAGMEGITVEVGTRLHARAASMTDENHPLVKSVLSAIHYLGGDETIGGFSMGTDGRFFSSKGIPTIILGPGDPSLAHKPNEWVGVDEVLEATRIYALAAATILGGESS